MTLIFAALPVATFTVAPKAVRTWVARSQHLPDIEPAARAVTLQIAGCDAVLMGMTLTTGAALARGTAQVTENVPSAAVVTVVLRDRLGAAASAG